MYRGRNYIANKLRIARARINEAEWPTAARENLSTELSEFRRPDESSEDTRNF